MKNLILLLTIIISIQTTAQVDSIYKNYKFISKNDAVVYSLTFIAGMAEGFRDALSFHFSTGVQKTLPNINPNFWNPKISWVNKNESDFLRLFPMFSDGWHAVNVPNHLGNVAAIAISTSDFQGKYRGWRLLRKAAFSILANRAGFLLTYNVIFRDRVN